MKKISVIVLMCLFTVTAFAAQPTTRAKSRTISGVTTAMVNLPQQFGNVSSVSAGKVRAKNAQGQEIEFVLGANANQVNVGQKTWLIENRAYVVDFPIETSKKSHIGQGDWMESTVKLSNTGNMFVKTHTWTTACQDGFTGGIRVILMDRSGNDVYYTDLKKYGVNGTCIPTAASSRHDDFTAAVPLDKLNLATKIAIVHRKSPTNRVDEFLDNAQQVVEILKTASEVYTNIAGGPSQGPGGTPGGTTPPGN
jgi:hypothetical protein